MCAQCDVNYNVLAPLVIGGPTGDYFVACPVQSARWSEFSIICVSNGHSGVASIFVSGDDVPKQPDYTGLSTNVTSGDSYFNNALAIRVPIDTSLPFTPDTWFRVTNSQKKVFVRIDVTSGGSAYVTLRFRNRLLTVVPGPAPAEHPDSYHQMNLRREETTRQSLAAAGIPGYALDPEVK